MFVVCLREHVLFCRFDKTDAPADVQGHFNHRLPLLYRYFPAQSKLGAVYYIGKIVRTYATAGSRTLPIHPILSYTLSTRPDAPLINVIAVFKYLFQKKNDSNSTLLSDIFHMKSQFYKLFIKLVTGFGGHALPNVYNLYISESLNLLKKINFIQTAWYKTV